MTFGYCSTNYLFNTVAQLLYSDSTLNLSINCCCSAHITNFATTQKNIMKFEQILCRIWLHRCSLSTKAFQLSKNLGNLENMAFHLHILHFQTEQNSTFSPQRKQLKYVYKQCLGLKKGYFFQGILCGTEGCRGNVYENLMCTSDVIRMKQINVQTN
jgi:hypothetical protein